MIREKLFAMVCMTDPGHDLHWRMTPIALSKIIMSQDGLVEMAKDRKPVCLGYPVDIVQPRVYKASEIAFGPDAPMVTL